MQFLLFPSFKHHYRFYYYGLEENTYELDKVPGFLRLNLNTKKETIKQISIILCEDKNYVKEKHQQ
jgi:hypothetical protein